MQHARREMRADAVPGTSVHCLTNACAHEYRAARSVQGPSSPATVGCASGYLFWGPGSLRQPLLQAADPHAAHHAGGGSVSLRPRLDAQRRQRGHSFAPRAHVGVNLSCPRVHKSKATKAPTGCWTPDSNASTPTPISMLLSPQHPHAEEGVKVS
jgi:hypothetical protein